MRTPYHAWILLLLLTGNVSPAAAQAIDSAPGSAEGLFGGRRRPLDPNRTSQELELTLDLGGGHDQSIGSQGEAVPDPALGTVGTAYISAAAAELRYRRGHVQKSIEGTGHAFVNYANAGTQRVIRGTTTVQASTNLGRRSGLTAGIGAAYEPTFLFNAFNAFGPVVEQAAVDVVPGESSSRGITEQVWLATHGSASLYRNWTTRQRMEFQVGGSQRQPLSGPRLDSRSQSGSVRHSWDFSRSAGLLLSYRYVEQTQTDAIGNDLPLRSQAADIGVRLEHRISARRRLGVTVGGGATQARTQPSATRPGFDFIVPSVWGTARLDLTRTWGLSADVRRDVTVLEGLTPEPFATDVASVRTDASVTRRVRVAMSGAYFRGAARLGTGSFDTAAGSAQVQYAMARCCALVTRYTYYEHRLHDLALLQPGFPSRYHRNSVRLGLTLWLPLYGTF